MLPVEIVEDSSTMPKAINSFIIDDIVVLVNPVILERATLEMLSCFNKRRSKVVAFLFRVSAGFNTNI
jgi:hypothetical protein